MLKKGQPGWIDNAKPCGTEPQVEEYVRVPHKSKGKKRFGIRWNRKKGYRWNWKWTQWYHTERDRDEAAKALKKNRFWLTNNFTMEFVER